MLAELTFFARLLAERYPHGLGGDPAVGATPLTHAHQLAIDDVRAIIPDLPA